MVRLVHDMVVWAHKDSPFWRCWMQVIGRMRFVVMPGICMRIAFVRLIIVRLIIMGGAVIAGCCAMPIVMTLVMASFHVMIRNSKELIDLRMIAKKAAVPDHT